jgi:ABC-type multidrug transport system ATPase subunit
MIEVKGISKRFNNKNIIEDLSFKVSSGIFHLIGKNGTGKSTLLNMLSGVYEPDSGSIIYDSHNLYGKNNRRIKFNIGYVPDLAPIYPFTTGKEFIRFICKVKRSDTPDNLLNDFKLNQHYGSQFGDMSYGTKKKFLLVAGLLNSPKYLLLDEPFNGLDSNSANALYKHIHNHLSDNKVCILITHEKTWESKFKENFHYTGLNLNKISTKP